ncbi:hypothetical protein [Niabella sp.]|uniref:hypothetical protein n=1 Tax=Niabella sp. TaxID=1962976 RepID=UPI00263400AB|nr:hypothetical protein [Niabella sp.]
MQIPFSTYIINLKSRPDRKKAVLKEFKGKDEFRVTVVEAISHEIGLIGLWQTMKHILKDLVHPEEEYILICQDDHQFTEHYSYELLKECITEAVNLDADILLGGISWFQTTYQSSQHLYWIEKFSGLQFAIIFRKFFTPLLNLGLDDFNAGDYRISAFTDKKWVIHPYISIQRDYGYSDVTSKNNKPEIVEKLFIQSDKVMQTLKGVAKHLRTITPQNGTDLIDVETITIPTFIINLPERKDRLAHIQRQFQYRKEFDITIVAAIKEPVGALGLWQTIRNIITKAVQNDEDLVIICEDDHIFTEHYSKNDFIRSVLTAHQLGADLLIGGPSGGFAHILPVADNLGWIDAFYGCQFMVVYKKMFPIILNEPFDVTVKADNLLSEIAVNKLSFQPFISVQKDFGYSDVNDDIRASRPINSIFDAAQKRFERVFSNFSTYGAGY